MNDEQRRNVAREFKAVKSSKSKNRRYKHSMASKVANSLAATGVQFYFSVFEFSFSITISSCSKTAMFFFFNSYAGCGFKRRQILCEYASYLYLLETIVSQNL